MPSAKNDRHCGSIRTSVQVVVEAPACLGEDAGQDRRQREDRRPHIEAEAVRFEDCCLASEPVIPFEENDVVTARRQGTRRRQSAQTSANDTDAAGCGAILRTVFFANAPNAHSLSRPCDAPTLGVKARTLGSWSVSDCVTYRIRINKYGKFHSS